jgi:hypothetical protein
MKHFYLMALICLISTSVFAQASDCKLIDLQGPNKEKFKGIICKSLTGNLMLYKLNGKLNGQYTVRGIYSVLQSSDNMIDLRIDSVRFTYADQSTVTFKVTGTGHTKNSNASLKPIFETIQFTFALDPGRLRTAFENPAITGFAVFAEKEAQYTEMFTGKQQAFFAKNIVCLENQ